MNIRYDLSSDDVDRQIELLKLYPEIADRHYRPALTQITNVLAAEIRPRIPQRTGTALKAFKSKVLGKGVSIRGEVGWWGAAGKKAWYMRFIEGGTKSVGPLEPTKRKVLKFEAGGETLFRRSVQHKGVSARGFMADAWKRATSLAQERFGRANEAIVKELALPG